MPTGFERGIHVINLADKKTGHFWVVMLPKKIYAVRTVIFTICVHVKFKFSNFYLRFVKRLEIFGGRWIWGEGNIG